MSKKIKFALIMENGVQVRTLEELKENFSIERVIEYFNDGKLITWLNDRYYDEEVEKIKQLDKESKDFVKDLYEVFDLEYKNEEINIQNIEEKNRRTAIIKEFTDNEEILNNIDLVAFNQEELACLLDNGAKVIYLFGENFKIPIRIGNVSYIGINNPVVDIASKSDVNFIENAIEIKGVKFNNMYNVNIITEKESNNDKILNSDEKMNLAKEYMEGSNGKKKNYVKAFNLYKEVADEDNDEALIKLGECYEKGYGVEENVNEAFKCFKQASLFGSDLAYVKLGYCYYNGIGTMIDLKQALKYFEKISKEEQEKIKKDIRKCKFEICKKEAESGDAQAECDLGGYYYSDKNYTIAVEWYKKSSQKGCGEATRNLGICYQHGLGVSKNSYEARSCYMRAMSQGDSLAETLLDMLNRK